MGFCPCFGFCFGTLKALIVPEIYIKLRKLQITGLVLGILGFVLPLFVVSSGLSFGGHIALNVFVSLLLDLPTQFTIVPSLLRSSELVNEQLHNLLESDRQVDKLGWQLFGLGLGLATSGNIIQKYNGNISVRNVPDGGAIFTDTLAVNMDRS